MTIRSSNALRPKPADALVALAVLAAAVGLGAALWSGPAPDTLTAVISQNGREVESVNLSRLTGTEERVLTANGYTLHLALGPDGARMTEADCPGQDCVHTGAISAPGQSIVCLPARVSVTLVGTADSGVDAVLG